MNIKNSFSVAASEIKIEKRLFSVLFVMVLLLFSVSIAVMDAAVYLPQYISNAARENRFDRFRTFGFHSPDELRNLLSEQSVSFRLESCKTAVLNDAETGESIFCGVLFRDYLNDRETEMLRQPFCAGTADDTFFGSVSAIVSLRFAERTGLSVGDTVFMEHKQKNIRIPAEICAVCADAAERSEVYISEEALHAFQQAVPGQELELTAAPARLGDIFRMKHALETSGKLEFHSKETLDLIRMLYITFYAVNIILLIALTGSVYNLLNIYLQRRNGFYAVQSAIGMSSRDIMRILLCMPEACTVLTAAVAAVLSSGLLHLLMSYSAGLFQHSYGGLHLPRVPLAADFALLQLMMFGILLRFRHKLIYSRIIGLLHEK